MKLFVRVVEARNLPARETNVFSDPYVKLQLGRQKFKTKVKHKCLNPSWCEEFIFKVDSVEQELIISVLDEDKYHHDFASKIKVPVYQVLEATDKSLGTNWYILQPKSKKSKNKDCGEIRLTICFLPSSTLTEMANTADRCLIVPGMHAPMQVDSLSGLSSPIESSSPRLEEIVLPRDEKSHLPTLANRIVQLFSKNVTNVDASPATSVEANNVSDLPKTVGMVVEEQSSEEKNPSAPDFHELLKKMEMRNQGVEVSTALSGGVVIDQLYGLAPEKVNSLLFSSDSDFLNSLAEIQGSTNLHIGQWRFENEGNILKRVVSYTKAPSKLIKALKTTEEQAYLKADGKAFTVLSSVETPDAPYGNTFKVEVLYCITLGPELPCGDKSSRLEVSWRVNFMHSSIMKGMIESGTKQGIKESFDQYKNLLSQKVEPLDLKNINSEKDQVLESLQMENQSVWKLAIQYFANYTVLSTILIGLYVLVHMCLSMPSTPQGLEFGGLDLPDSIGEFIVSGLLFLQGKRLLEMWCRFMQARSQKGSDHGIKAQGDGWLLTIALIEGRSLAAVNGRQFSDPYVVFTCNGKTRTCSVKFQKSDPVWNEIFEFDAMEEPPSVLSVEVFDFDGPFDEATSLGSAEISFLRSNLSELSDIWIPLQGNLAQACQSKLRLRIFLNNNMGPSMHKDFISKMEKEIGKKIKMRSPQTNSAFQKLFGLPSEELLINDFVCHLKRKMPLRGRMYLSARVIGFHADLFGNKIKFFILWEDIEDISVTPPTLSSIGSPIIVMTLRAGRGHENLHGAKCLDSNCRLEYHFHSFVAFNIAHRTIMALWRARSMAPAQKAKIEEAESIQSIEDEPIAKNTVHSASGGERDTGNLKKGGHSVHRTLHSEKGDSSVGSEDVKMSVIYSSVLSLPASFFMELFNGGKIDRQSMERVGFLSYSHSPWESVKPQVQQRQLYYKFDKPVPPYRGELSSIQQKTHLMPGNRWLIDEVITLHDVPYWDYFSLHIRYQVEDSTSKPTGCNVQVSIGFAWLRYMKHSKRITENIRSNFERRLKAILGFLEEEYDSGSY